MPYYSTLGQIPPKRHIQFRRPDGALYSEEVFGTEGFVGPTSTIYHIHPPTQVTGWKTLYSTKAEYVETDTMRMRHLKSGPMPQKGDPITGRVVLFGNADCEMSVCCPAEPMDYHYKNGQGDECLFIHFGSGTCHTQFGTLKFRTKDYIIIPKGTIYKLVFDEQPADEPPVKFLVIETCNHSHIGPPPRYVSKTTSQFLEHAPYCERDLRGPELPLTFDEAGSFEVRIKARDCVHTYTYDYHPLDVVGWDGCYYPYCFNIDDFSPITGAPHAAADAPDVRGTQLRDLLLLPADARLAPGSDSRSLQPLEPDSDEVLYYVEGDYKARKGIEVGSLTLHPQGIPHGPHPGTVEKSIGAEFTNELAVMCDTFRPLHPTKAALELDDSAYPASWEGEHFPQTAGTHRPDGSHA